MTQKQLKMIAMKAFHINLGFMPSFRSIYISDIFDESDLRFTVKVGIFTYDIYRFLDTDSSEHYYRYDIVAHHDVLTLRIDTDKRYNDYISYLNKQVGL